MRGPKIELVGAWYPPIKREELMVIFTNIYNRLLQLDAVTDLSLPPLNVLNASLDKCLANISIQFVKVPPAVLRLNESKTSSSLLTRKSDIVINYYEFEVRERKQVINARVTHEGTHALRAQLVMLCTSTEVSSSQQQLETPEKQQYWGRGLIFMEEDQFHSGFWMEHQLIGGVWLSLDSNGLILNINDDTVVTVTDRKGMLFFAKRRTGTVVRKVNGIDARFHALSGNYTGSRNILDDSTIYIHGTMTTRKGGWCRRNIEVVCAINC